MQIWHVFAHSRIASMGGNPAKPAEFGHSGTSRQGDLAAGLPVDDDFRDQNRVPDALTTIFATKIARQPR